MAELGLQKPDAARKTWERALTLDENYFPAVENLALLDLFDGKPEVAGKRFESVLARQPSNLGAQLVAWHLLERESGRAIDSSATVDITRRPLPNPHPRAGDGSSPVWFGADRTLLRVAEKGRALAELTVRTN